MSAGATGSEAARQTLTPGPQLEQAEQPVMINKIQFDGRSVWRASLIVLVVVALAAFAMFVIRDGGGVLYTVLMSWFAATALEPGVRALTNRGMRRNLATATVMGGLALFGVVFILAFGNLLVQQVAALLRLLPDVAHLALDWVNNQFGSHYTLESLMGTIHLTPEKVTAYANTILGGVLGILGSAVGTFFSGFTFALLTFYFSADNPRLRIWLAQLLPAKAQQVFISVWDLTTLKVGRYVAARAILAAINGGTSAIVFILIGLPSWLALGLWTGLVAQFVPTIGTYISITLPVLVGLLSDRPWTGLAALAWAIVYQQVENIFIEPKISSRAVDMHPAVAFASVLLGTSLFGVGGALTAIPVTAALLALFDIYGHRFELAADIRAGGDGDIPIQPADDDPPEPGSRETLAPQPS